MEGGPITPDEVVSDGAQNDGADLRPAATCPRCVAVLVLSPRRLSVGRCDIPGSRPTEHVRRGSGRHTGGRSGTPGDARTASPGHQEEGKAGGVFSDRRRYRPSAGRCLKSDLCGYALRLPRYRGLLRFSSRLVKSMR